MTMRTTAGAQVDIAVLILDLREVWGREKRVGLDPPHITRVRRREVHDEEFLEIENPSPPPRLRPTLASVNLLP